jgi:serine acetyltransferase
MIRFIWRIYHKIWRIFFRFTQKSVFQTLGQGAYLTWPFRVDGGKGITIKEDTSIQRGVWLYCCGVGGLQASLSIGKGCVLGYNNHITSVGKVVIGDYVLTANNVYISDNIHGYEDVALPIIKQPVQFKRAVEIGDGCWIGENACIIGASVGKNSVIGANAVVTTDIPEYSVAVGVPARVIKSFDFDSNKWVVLKNADNG